MAPPRPLDGPALMPERPSLAVFVLGEAFLHGFDARETFLYGFGVRGGFLSPLWCRGDLPPQFWIWRGLLSQFSAPVAQQGAALVLLALALARNPSEGKRTSFVDARSCGGAAKLRLPFSSRIPMPSASAGGRTGSICAKRRTPSSNRRRVSSLAISRTLCPEGGQASSVRGGGRPP